jgi:hypothetical protein
VLEPPQVKSDGSAIDNSISGARRISVLWLVVAILCYVGLRLAVLQTNFDARSFAIGPRR